MNELNELNDRDDEFIDVNYRRGMLWRVSISFMAKATTRGSMEVAKASIEAGPSRASMNGIEYATTSAGVAPVGGENEISRRE